MTVVQNFTIHPVGQGLFYSGNLIFNHQNFNFVMDCGSINGTDADREVVSYRDARLQSKKLDLLVISHFDADHVSHIYKLLEGGVKVRRLVMPMLTYVERLFLVLRNETDDRTNRFILDPIGELRDNLDGDSEVYLVEHDPDPIGPDNTDLPNEPTLEFNGDNRLEFDYEKKQLIPESRVKMYQVLDRNKGFTATGIVRLMDFLFYKRPLETKEEEFYKEVAKVFYNRTGIDPSIASNKNSLVERIATFRNATTAKDIFCEAAVNIGIAPSTVDNLNTTALCMLHRNLPAFHQLLPQIPPHPFGERGFRGEANHVILFKGHNERMWQREDFYPGVFKYVNKAYVEWFYFPNVMLTSDSCLLSKKDVDLFKRKYKHYLDHFWLMQVPHHGSRHNSGQELLDYHLFDHRSYFINYGLNNRFDHPAEEVIKELNKAWGYRNFIPVHEKQGLVFNLQYYDR